MWVWSSVPDWQIVAIYISLLRRCVLDIINGALLEVGMVEEVEGFRDGDVASKMSASSK